MHVRHILFAFFLIFQVGVATSIAQNEPSKDEFIEVDEEPRPLVDIQRLVVYPPEASRAGIQGSVVVSALIGTDGLVSKVDIEKPDHESLNDAAVSAMKQARFSPAKFRGKSVQVWYTQKILFRLNDNSSESNRQELFKKLQENSSRNTPSNRDSNRTTKP